MNPSSALPTLATTVEPRPLTDSPRLHFDAASCLPIRFAGTSCTRCAEACPAQAISHAGGRPLLRGECLGCGRCAVVCSSGALQVQGFALPALLPASGPLEIDCWRVPVAVSPPGTVRIPCLAGLGLGWLLALYECSGGRAIDLLDRGHCVTCPAGGLTALRARIEEARALLLACGAAPDALPRLVERPTRAVLAPAIPDPTAEQSLDRRGFFRGLMASGLRGADQVRQLGRAQGTSAEPIVLRAAVQPADRLRAMTSLTRLARRHGRPIPNGVLTRLTLEHCAGCGVCARVCPSGALSYKESNDVAELVFYAARCIGCAQCVARCPEQALGLHSGDGHSLVTTLARWPARHCTHCGTPFFGAGGDTCAGCAGKARLVRGMAALLRPSL